MNEINDKNIENKNICILALLEHSIVFFNQFYLIVIKNLLVNNSFISRGSKISFDTM